jgi:DNA-binding NtrC family response regulator
MSEIPSRILCVDDEDPILFTRRHILERAGYLVFTAKTGKEGMAIFREQPIDMVILDYWMADMDGLHVATEMKRINRKTPIIVSSGYAPILDEGLAQFQNATVVRLSAGLRHYSDTRPSSAGIDMAASEQK